MKSLPACGEFLESLGRVFEPDEGRFVISDECGWLVGSYSTQAAAEAAFRLTEAERVTLRDRYAPESIPLEAVREVLAVPQPLTLELLCCWLGSKGSIAAVHLNPVWEAHIYTWDRDILDIETSPVLRKKLGIYACVLGVRICLKSDVPEHHVRLYLEEGVTHTYCLRHRKRSEGSSCPHCAAAKRLPECGVLVEGKGRVFEPEEDVFTISSHLHGRLAGVYDTQEAATVALSLTEVEREALRDTFRPQKIPLGAIQAVLNKPQALTIKTFAWLTDPSGSTARVQLNPSWENTVMVWPSMACDRVADSYLRQKLGLIANVFGIAVYLNPEVPEHHIGLLREDGSMHTYCLRHRERFEGSTCSPCVEDLVQG